GTAPRVPAAPSTSRSACPPSPLTPSTGTTSRLGVYLGVPVGPGGGLLELAGDPDKQVFPPVRRDQLYADGQAAWRPVQRQGNGRLPGHVELRGIGDEADDSFPLMVRAGCGE